MTVDAPRFLDMAGLHNFRDIGGYPTADGATTRWGRVLRAGQLNEIGEAAHPQIDELGLRTIIDLREDVERAKSPASVYPAGLTVLRHPLYHDRIVLGDIDDLGVLYTQILDRCADTVTAALEHLAAPGALPALVHCSAGKDRTGLIIGLLLSALGVPDEIVAEDYAVTERAYTGEDRERMIRKGLALGAKATRIEHLIGSPPETMRAALAGLRARHGSVETYLLEGGLRPDSLAALRTALVEPA
ncbi:MAG TPA: tyrosine-protein phosphatase [Sporichthya sp.]|nr:tyrosine-protein phosphatase [Sporichthya sp.]